MSRREKGRDPMPGDVRSRMPVEQEHRRSRPAVPGPEYDLAGVDHRELEPLEHASDCSLPPASQSTDAAGGERLDRGRPRLNCGSSALLAQLVEHLHGKEGVDGSSPSEGSAKAPQNGVFCIRAGLHSSRSLGCGKRFGKTGPSAHTQPPPHGACP